MQRRDRFELEIRTVVVSWRAGVRAVASGNGRSSQVLAERASQLLDRIEQRYADLANEPAGRARLEEAREHIRAGQPWPMRRL